MECITAPMSILVVSYIDAAGERARGKLRRRTPVPKP